MINILFFLCCLVTSSTSQIADGMKSISQEYLDLERQLKLINKPPIKSIEVYHALHICCICFFLIYLISLHGLINYFSNFGLIQQTKFGYIVDCIDINKQPAFDHPLLKNHKLQVNTL